MQGTNGVPIVEHYGHWATNYGHLVPPKPGYAQLWYIRTHECNLNFAGRLVDLATGGAIVLPVVVGVTNYCPGLHRVADTVKSSNIWSGILSCRKCQSDSHRLKLSRPGHALIGW